MFYTQKVNRGIATKPEANIKAAHNRNKEKYGKWQNMV